LGKSTSESEETQGDSSITLDFGLSKGMLDDPFKKAWPYDFGLVYSVTLTKASLVTSLQVQNNGAEAFDFQVLFHSYFRVEVCSRSSSSRRNGEGNKRVWI
jgi:glucose-6-phosphate 1-epimerase